nr:ADP-heptose synthase [Brevibacillus laterosporus]
MSKEEETKVKKPFVIEAIMLAIYGNLLVPSEPVEYLIPSSTLRELDEFIGNSSPIMHDPEEEQRVREIIGDMIQYFHNPFRRKMMEKSLVAPWSTVTFEHSDIVHFTIVKAEDTAMWGEIFDPIETELILTAMKWDVPLITDQTEWQDRLLEYVIPIQFYDIEDFDFAVEPKLYL